MDFEVVIGIEVHAQLKTKTKLFGGSSTQFGAHPNTNVDPVCLGLPGALPVLNREAIQMAVIAGLALNCQVRQDSVFARKNYFYPDLPKGYQISQFDKPICESGYLDIVVDGQEKRIGITRIHMEEDAGKLLHQGAGSIAGATHSYVDLNRAGTPLIEIVSEPDIRSAKEARVYLEELKMIVQHMGVCDGNMEEGSLRADANISIRPVGQSAFGTRTEIKNLNSFRSVERAILGEVKRQKAIVLSGGAVVQETRNYDDVQQITTVMRSKEDAHDYRYFPEPDLPPLSLSSSYIEKVRQVMPLCPREKRTLYSKEYGLSDFEIKVLLGDVLMDRYFEICVSEKGSLSEKAIAKWVVGELNALIKESDADFSTTKARPKHLVALLKMKQEKTVSGKMAKEILGAMVQTGAAPQSLMQSESAQISDQSELQAVVDEVLNANEDVVQKIKSGKTNSANFLMGQVMKATKGRANPDLVRDLILTTVENR